MYNKEGATMAEQVLIQFRADKALKLPFEATIPEATLTKAETVRAFEDLRSQVINMPETILKEINAEISTLRT